MTENQSPDKWGGEERERGMAFHFSAADFARLATVTQTRPKPGDLCIADKHVGDHLHTYIVCRRRSDGLHAPKFTFSAYEFGECLFRLTPSDYMRVKNQEIVNLTPYAHNPFPDTKNDFDNDALTKEIARVKTINDDTLAAERQLQEIWRKINPPEPAANKNGDVFENAFKRLSEEVTFSFKKNPINFHTPDLSHLEMDKSTLDGFWKAAAAAKGAASDMDNLTKLITQYGIKKP